MKGNYHDTKHIRKMQENLSQIKNIYSFEFYKKKFLRFFHILDL